MFIKYIKLNINILIRKLKYRYIFFKSAVTEKPQGRKGKYCQKKQPEGPIFWPAYCLECFRPVIGF